MAAVPTTSEVSVETLHNARVVERGFRPGKARKGLALGSHVNSITADSI